MSDPVYSLITDLNGNGPCMAPYPYENTRLVAMITPCPFADRDVIHDSAKTSFEGCNISYGRGFIKATSSAYYCGGMIGFRLKHNGENRILRITTSPGATWWYAYTFLMVNNEYAEGQSFKFPGDNIIVPPYYRYQLQLYLAVTQSAFDEEDYEEIWVKAEIF